MTGNKAEVDAIYKVFKLYFLKRNAQEMEYFKRNAKPVYDVEP